MENPFAPYECIFTAEERKRMVAQSLQELRKAKGYSQKEVAALLGMAQPTYSSYERGRTEPNSEMLVRLAYLYGVSIDIILQKPRMYRTFKEAEQVLTEFSEELLKIKGAVTQSGDENAAKSYALLEQLIRSTEKVMQIPGLDKQTDATLTPEAWEKMSPKSSE